MMKNSKKIIFSVLCALTAIVLLMPMAIFAQVKSSTSTNEKICAGFLNLSSKIDQRLINGTAKIEKKELKKKIKLRKE